MARVFTFRRTLVQTRKRGHTATGAACYRLGLAAESRFTGTDGAPRSFDFTKRHGIGEAGCALPDGAADAWRDPLEWARRIEAVDYRSNSRQFRDDVIGIPRELIAEGNAEQVIAAYAQRIAAKWKTPVHFVIHDEHGKNPHAHVMYAGRSVDGESFARKRDREQDQKPDPNAGSNRSRSCTPSSGLRPCARSDTRRASNRSRRPGKPRTTSAPKFGRARRRRSKPRRQTGSRRHSIRSSRSTLATP